MKHYRIMGYTVYGNGKKTARMPSDPDPPNTVLPNSYFSL